LLRAEGKATTGLKLHRQANFRVEIDSLFSADVPSSETKSSLAFFAKQNSSLKKACVIKRIVLD